MSLTDTVEFGAWHLPDRPEGGGRWRRTCGKCTTTQVWFGDGKLPPTPLEALMQGGPS